MNSPDIEINFNRVILGLMNPKPSTILAFAVLGVLLAAGVLMSTNLADPQSFNTSQASRWTQSAGLGISVPACASAVSHSTTCSNGVAQATISWADPDSHGEGVNVDVCEGSSGCSLGIVYTPAGMFNSTGWDYFTLPAAGSVLLTPLKSETSYNYSLRSITATGGVTVAAAYPTFTTPNCTPAPPTGASGSCSGSNATATWNPSAGATSYTLAIDREPSSPTGWNGGATCAGGAYSGDTYNCNAASPYSLPFLAGAGYGGGVSACNAAGCSAPATIDYFSCPAPPPLPTCSVSPSSVSGAAGSLQSVTINATNDADNRLPYDCGAGSWGSNPSGVSVGPFSFTMPNDSQNCTLTAQNSIGQTQTCPFSINVGVPSTYTLTVNSSGASGVAIAGNPAPYGGTTNYTINNITSGTGITLTAPATSGGQNFSNWTGDCTGGNPCALTMNSNKTVTANYFVGGAGPTLSVAPSCDGATSRLGLSWTPYAGATQYNVRRCAGSSCTSYASAVGYFGDSSWTNLGNVGAVTSYFDTAVSAGQTWSYVINTWDGDWNNPPSNISFATAQPCGSPNQPPVAEAGISIDGVTYTNFLTVVRGTTYTNFRFSADRDVNGDAVASYDPNGWTDATNGVSSGGKCDWNSDLNQGAPTFETTINNPASPASCNSGPYTKTFNDTPGDYVYQVLRITDRLGAQSNVSSVTVRVTAPNAAPAPNTGPGHALSTGVSHTHSGASATDPDGNLASYNWTWVSCPSACPALSASSGSIAGGNANISGPTYTPNVAGSFTLRLTVTDSLGLSASSNVTENTSASPPTAYAGPTHFITAGIPHGHTGGTASDPDNNLGSYRWLITHASCPSGVCLDTCPGNIGCPPISGGASPVSIPAPTFTPPVAGTYGIDLSVFDSLSAWASDSSSDVANNPPVPLACSPASWQVTIGTDATFTASGGSSGAYAWSAPAGAVPSTSGSGSSFTLRYNTSGTRSISLTRGSEGPVTCTLRVLTFEEVEP